MPTDWKRVATGNLGVSAVAMAGVMLGLALLLPAVAWAEGATPQNCRYANSAACRATNRAVAPRPYEQWQDGSPAVGSSHGAPQSQRYFRGYNSLYGFGR